MHQGVNLFRKKQQFERLAVFLSIFEVDTKIISDYKFVTPLILLKFFQIDKVLVYLSYYISAQCCVLHFQMLIALIKKTIKM